MIEESEKEVNKNFAQPSLSSGTFQGFNEKGLLKITAKAKTMEEALQTSYDIFGNKVTIWTFKWQW